MPDWNEREKENTEDNVHVARHISGAVRLQFKADIYST
jgi:hypothetical protein